MMKLTKYIYEKRIVNTETFYNYDENVGKYQKERKDTFYTSIGYKDEFGRLQKENLTYENGILNEKITYKDGGLNGLFLQRMRNLKEEEETSKYRYLIRIMRNGFSFGQSINNIQAPCVEKLLNINLTTPSLDMDRQTVSDDTNLITVNKFGK
jgi:hypothetical protein